VPACRGDRLYSQAAFRAPGAGDTSGPGREPGKVQRSAGYAALRETAAQLEHAQAVARLAVGVRSGDGSVHLLRARPSAIYGLAPREFLISEDFTACVHPDDRRYLHRSWRRWCRRGDVRPRFSGRGQCAEKWVHERAVLERADDGAPRVSLACPRTLPSGNYSGMRWLPRSNFCALALCSPRSYRRPG